MNHSHALKTSALALLALLLPAACSSSSSSGDKAAFCKTNAEISASVNAAGPDQLVAAFKKVEGNFDAYLKSAPKEVKSDAQALVDAARTAIQSGDAIPFATDVTLQQASGKVDSFCGSPSASSSTGSSTTAAPVVSDFTLSVADGWQGPVVGAGSTGYIHADGSTLTFRSEVADFDPAAYLDSVSSSPRYSNRTEAKPVTLAGEKGLTREADLEGNGVTRHVSLTIVGHNGKRFTIEYSAASVELFAAHAAEVQSMFDSLAFTN
jgi:hypothetical protein